MNKQYIEEGRVNALLKDLAKKVCRSICTSDLAEKPLLLVGVGGSGGELVRQFLKILLLTEEAKNKRIGNVSIDRNPYKSEDGQSTIRIIRKDQNANGDKLPQLLSGGDILIMDDIERTGETMRVAHETIARNFTGRENVESKVRIWSYCLAVSSNASYVPAWYGYMYPSNVFISVADESGTAPNHALGEPKNGIGPFQAFQLRKAKPDDPNFTIQMPASMARYHAVDRFFDHETKSKSVMILEKDGEAIGYVSYYIDGANLWISGIAICDTKREIVKGGGFALFSHVETYALTSGCKKILLWAISTAVERYKTWGLVERDQVSVTIPATDISGAEIYKLMALRLDVQKHFKF